MYFLSSVREDGEVLSSPKNNLMPKRQELTFYLRRDPSASNRLAADSEFAKKVTEILNSLPTR